jgi:hypothetical protein
VGANVPTKDFRGDRGGLTKACRATVILTKVYRVKVDTPAKDFLDTGILTKDYRAKVDDRRIRSSFLLKPLGRGFPAALSSSIQALA